MKCKLIFIVFPLLFVFSRSSPSVLDLSDIEILGEHTEISTDPCESEAPFTETTTEDTIENPRKEAPENSSASKSGDQVQEEGSELDPTRPGFGGQPNQSSESGSQSDFNKYESDAGDTDSLQNESESAGSGSPDVGQDSGIADHRQSNEDAVQHAGDNEIVNPGETSNDSQAGIGDVSDLNSEVNNLTNSKSNAETDSSARLEDFQNQRVNEGSEPNAPLQSQNNSHPRSNETWQIQEHSKIPDSQELINSEPSSQEQYNSQQTQEQRTDEEQSQEQSSSEKKDINADHDNKDEQNSEKNKERELDDKDSKLSEQQSDGNDVESRESHEVARNGSNDISDNHIKESVQKQKSSQDSREGNKNRKHSEDRKVNRNRSGENEDYQNINGSDRKNRKNVDGEENDNGDNKSREILEQFIRDKINQVCNWKNCNALCRSNRRHGGYCKYGNRCTCY